LFGVQVEIVRHRSSRVPVLPKRWIVERMVGQVSAFEQGYEHLPPNDGELVYLSMIHLMLKRLSIVINSVTNTFLLLR
jgi:hypothetical protein